jgi:hypothetical protein
MATGSAAAGFPYVYIVKINNSTQRREKTHTQKNMYGGS